MSYQEIEKNLRSWVYKNISSITFDKFVEYCKFNYDKPCHSIAEIKANKSTKVIGDIFETFCRLYLLNVGKYQQVWFLANLPSDIRAKLKLSANDMGIDLIAFDGTDYSAVQCKYRTKSPYKKTQSMSWKELSTFYALATRSGPYKMHIVMTNLDSVRHVGKKTAQDKSICYRSFCKMNSNDWLSFMPVQTSAPQILKQPAPKESDEENDVIDIISKLVKPDNLDTDSDSDLEIEDHPDQETLRKLRCKFFSKKLNQNSDEHHK